MCDKPAAPFKTDFAFWGERTYVHGSHMIYELQDACRLWRLGEIESITASFRFPLRTQAFYHLLGGESIDCEPCADFAVTCHGCGYQILAEPDSKAWVTRRIQDNESELVASARLDLERGKALLPEFPRKEYVNAITGLNKKLLRAHLEYKGDTQSSWVMGRIALLPHLLKSVEDAPLCLELKRVMAGRMALTNIYLGRSKLGQVYFNSQG